MNLKLSDLEILGDSDVDRAGRIAGTIAGRLGFDSRDRAGLTLVVAGFAAELARLEGGGRVDLVVEGDPARSLQIRVGPLHPDGIGAEWPEIARRVMDRLDVENSADLGPGIILTKALPRPVPTVDLAPITEEPPALKLRSGETLGQARDLFEALDNLASRDRELARVRRELEETHWGLMALHAELDEQADTLRRAIESKTRFLSNVSHELRTPLSSILGLARLLLDRADGTLSSEQDRQATFILRSAQDLAGMINELLDLGRLESGREVFQISEVDLTDLFGTLRGMLRPLLPSGSPVALILDDPAGLPPMITDGGKLAQVLRNLLSNALKFTETGEVRLRAEPGPSDSVVFSVSDTGIGIAPEHIPRIFEEFDQVEGPLQRLTKGTGMGLPVARKLARLLGGEVQAWSEPGVDSTFSAIIPVRFPGEGLRG